MPKAAIVELQVTADSATALRDLKKTEGALKDLEAAGQSVGSGASGIQEVTQATKDLQKASEDAGEASGGLSDSLAAGMAGGAVVAGLGKLSELVSAGFTAIAEKASEAFSNALDMTQGRAKLQAQLGVSAEDAARLGKLAGDLYSENYGDSLETVNEALSLVTREMGLNGLEQQDQLKDVTGDVLNLADTFDEDLAGVVSAVSQLMKTGLAKNSEEALDLITVGMQKGLNKSEDLLDTLEEYPTTWRELGVSGEKALGMIGQALKAGARDSDTVADALKEFSIRAQDASDTSLQAFQDIGLNGEEMTKIFAEGGPKAEAGLDSVIDALRNMEDPVARNRAAVGLFGTKAEDLGDALFAIDPSEAVEDLGKVGGAAAEMGTALGDTAPSKMESFKRSMETNVTTFLAETVVPGLNTFLTEAQKIFNTALESQWFKDLVQSLTDLKDAILPPVLEQLGILKDKAADFFKVVGDNKEIMETLKIVLIGIAIAVGAIIASFFLMMAVIGLVIALIVGSFMAVLIAWKKAWDAVKWAVEGVWGAINRFIFEMGTVGKNIWDWLTEGLNDKILDAQRLLDRFLGFIRRTVEDIKRILDALWDTLRKIKDALPGIPGLTIPGMAAGGIVTRPTVAMLGERGPEAVIPLSRMASSGSTINITVTHTGLGVDSPKLQRDIVEAIRRYERRNGH